MRRCWCWSGTTTRADLASFVGQPSRAAILLDFDGSLSEIVARPDLARPVDGAVEIMNALASYFGLVAVISGRPTDEVRDLVGVEGVHYEGSYGIGGPTVPDALPLAAIEGAAVPHPGATVEPKGVSVAVHYRACADTASSREALLPVLSEIAAGAGFELVEGKMVIELVPQGASHKGDVIERLVRDADAQAVLYAGDDLPDLSAFAALDRLRSQQGVSTVKVAVRGAETPSELIAAADTIVDGPAGLVEFLRDLLAAPAR